MMPTVESVVAACRGENDEASSTTTTTATTLLVQILESVITTTSSSANDLGAPMSAVSQQALDVLVGAVQSIQQGIVGSDGDDTLKATSLETAIAGSADTKAPSMTSTSTKMMAAARAFSNAFTSAVWWLSCDVGAHNSNLSSNTELVAVVKRVLEAAEGGSGTGDTKDSSTPPDLFGLPDHLLRSIADCQFLQAIGVIDATTDLPKKLRVMNTNINFRQHKFNLLSEETEGYSKFLYYLEVRGCGEERGTSSNPSSIHLLHLLIGTYSLDPNRCLDLTIDVFEYEMELTFEKETSRLGTESSLDWTLVMENNQVQFQFLQSVMNALRITAKLAPLLGFKLRGRLSATQLPQSSSTTNGAALSQNAATNVTSLLRCMAWLCLSAVDSNDGDEGGDSVASYLLKAEDVVPYLPDDSYNVSALIQSLYLQTIDAETERIRSVGRVRLTQSSNEAASTTVTVIDLKPLEQLMIVQWIQIFLQLHAYTKIQSILTPQEWSDLAVLLPTTVGTGILDGVERSMEQMSSSFSPLLPTPSFGSDNNDLAAMDTDPPTADMVLAQVVRPLASAMESGSIVHRPILYCKLCRLLSSLLRQDTSVAKSESLVDFLRSFLVPSLSVFNSSPALSMELWDVLQQLPYRVRYSLYASWKGGGLERASLQTSKPLWLTEGELLMGKSARYALKRLSKDTIRDMSRAVAKCCHSHPLVVFTTILNQIEAYDNLVQVMVDACRFVTPLSLDVLGFCILQRLSSSHTSGGASVSRTQVKENGVNVAQWLQSLESFTGAFYKSFPYVEFQGILCYLMQRLKDGHVMELGVLRTLLKNCAGWSFADYAPAASLSSTQLEGRAGSTALKRETMTFGIVSDINAMASNEVRRVLQADNIGVSLLILLAQVRHQIVFQSNSHDRPIPVKLIGNLVDTSQVVMAILLDFLTNAGDETRAEDARQLSAVETYAKSLPPLLDLYTTYGLDAQSIWMLSRPLVGARVEGRNEKDKLPVLAVSAVEFRNAAMSPSTQAHLSVELYELFYTSTLYDFFCPEDLYTAEIARLAKEEERLSVKLEKETVDRHSQKKYLSQPAPVQPSAHPEKPTKEELNRVKKTGIALRTDFLKQKEHVAAQHERMCASTGKFFTSDQISRESATAFFVYCIYPRCMQGPDDAMLCARFVSFLHQNATPGFGTLHYLDCAIVTLVRTLYCVTEGEAACASILLLEIWKTVSKWRYDESAFDEELAGKPGCFMVSKSDEGEKIVEPVTRKEYERLYNRWHAAIGATCIGCLQSTEYMHLRCSLVVLTRLVEEYPTRPKLANKLLEVLEPLQKESNAFADIRASAQAYSTQLLRSRDSGVWKEEDAATVEARLAMVNAAAAERQKKAEEQMKELKRESDQITEQIGEYDSRDRNSRGRGPQLSDKGSAIRSLEPDTDRRGNVVGGNDNTRRRAPLSPDPAEELRSGARQGPQARDPTQNAPAAAGADRRSRDRGNSYTSMSGDSTGASRRDEAPSRGGRAAADESQNRNLEGRWQHSTERNSPPRGSVGRKRSRPSSPTEQGETREEATTSKRAKPLPEDDGRGGGDDENPNRRSGQRRRAGGGSRR